jgi:ketosteroid isomerase-like protein
MAVPAGVDHVGPCIELSYVDAVHGRRRIAAPETADPEVIIAEHVVAGTLPTKATTFTVPGLLILHVHNGLITRVRDYMDSSGVASVRA